MPQWPTMARGSNIHSTRVPKSMIFGHLFESMTCHMICCWPARSLFVVGLTSQPFSSLTAAAEHNPWVHSTLAHTRAQQSKAHIQTYTCTTEVRLLAGANLKAGSEEICEPCNSLFAILTFCAGCSSPLGDLGGITLAGWLQLAEICTLYSCY